MKPSFFSSASLTVVFMLSRALGAALLPPVGAILPREAERSGGYAETCRNERLSHTNGGYYLVADCPTTGGHFDSTSIRLGDCFGNDQGNLVYEKNGAFGNSCEDVEIRGKSLSAECATGKGTFHKSTFNMDSAIGNINGRLVC